MFFYTDVALHYYLFSYKIMRSCLCIVQREEKARRCVISGYLDMKYNGTILGNGIKIFFYHIADVIFFHPDD